MDRENIISRRIGIGNHTRLINTLLKVVLNISSGGKIVLKRLLGSICCLAVANAVESICLNKNLNASKLSKHGKETIC